MKGWIWIKKHGCCISMSYLRSKLTLFNTDSRSKLTLSQVQVESPLHVMSDIEHDEL